MKNLHLPARAHVRGVGDDRRVLLAPVHARGLRRPCRAGQLCGSAAMAGATSPLARRRNDWTAEDAVIPARRPSGARHGRRARHRARGCLRARRSRGSCRRGGAQPRRDRDRRRGHAGAGLVGAGRSSSTFSDLPPSTCCARCGGALDVLVNNAGTNRPKPMTEITAEDFDAVVDLNVRSAYFVAAPSCVAWWRRGSRGRSSTCRRRWAMSAARGAPFIAPPSTPSRADKAFAVAVGVWSGRHPREHDLPHLHPHRDDAAFFADEAFRQAVVPRSSSAGWARSRTS